jgi:hypothetical protein
VPEVKFDRATIKKVQDKTGVYSGLRKQTNALKPLVVSLVEGAFREYVRSHKGKHITKKLEDESWDRFKSILLEHL